MITDGPLRPHGNAHLLADTPPQQSARTRIPRPAAADGRRDGAGGLLLCGAYEMNADLVHPLLRDLPQVIHIRAAAQADPRLQATAGLLTAELRQPGPGTQALVLALLDTLLVYALRNVLDRNAD
ncbi:cupin domain-containing protein [Actinoplanes sp. NPDC048796]|uniref:cupin domain-containing protein n=1 Tax=Actinoplanes sp. NPDC048796 TaxID=3155640 RepID=UPI0033FBB6AF